ncbi:YciI family protein [Nitrospirillum viridazoti]|uniref:YciI family protein n=1 Tax=Nitrospirillum viridazoti TaxID=3144925 RepID=UPI0009DA07F6
MPYFAFRGYDAVGSDAIRQRERPAHRAYLTTEKFGVRAVAGGMLVSDDGERTIGSLVILQAPDRASLMRFLEDEPFTASGLFERVEIERWDWGLGVPVSSCS